MVGTRVLKKMTGLALNLVPGPQAADQARQEVTRLLEDAFAVAFVDDASLMTSELVTNSVRHVRHPLDDTIRMEATVTDLALHVEVEDSGPGYAWDGPEESDADGGWGLVIVDRTADRWGILQDPTRTWFELDAPA